MMIFFNDGQYDSFDSFVGLANIKQQMEQRRSKPKGVTWIFTSRCHNCCFDNIDPQTFSKETKGGRRERYVLPLEDTYYVVCYITMRQWVQLYTQGVGRHRCYDDNHHQCNLRNEFAAVGATSVWSHFSCGTISMLNVVQTSAATQTNGMSQCTSRIMLIDNCSSCLHSVNEFKLVI
jgi:hypothetical protein